MGFRGNIFGSGVLIFTFGISLFIPSLIFVILKQSSYASGIVVSSIFILLFAILKRNFFDFSKNRYHLKLILVIVSLLIVHGIIAFLITRQLDVKRFVGSLFLLILMFLASYCFVILLNNTTNKIVTNALTFVLFLLLLISFFGGVLSYIPLIQYATLNRPIFPFMEPSHFSLIIAPFYLWVIVISKRLFHRIILIFYALFVLLFISNLTLACVISIGVFLALGMKKFVFFTPLFILLISISNFDLNYYSRRVDIEDKNLSTLVWLQGWEEAYIDFEDSVGFGIGLQQFGVNDPKGDAANMILDLTKDYMNRYDGGTFASKLLGEFGIFGGIIIFFFLRKVYQSLIFLKHFSNRRNKSEVLVFYHCCVSYFIIEIFVRSMSYIAPGFFMFMVGMIGINLYDRFQEYQVHEAKIVAE